MTIREYIENNIEEVVGDLCQLQSCDNCCIGGINYEECPLLRHDISEAIDIEFDNVHIGKGD